MKIPVLIERIAEEHYRASVWDIVAEGKTGEIARQRLEDALHLSGKEIGMVTIAEKNPWLEIAGIFKDEPLYEPWQEAIHAYRRQVDEEDKQR
jgi:predicted RNase H-like HicB family nuclease